ncbi:hypothetical protein F5Y06DRAFT_303218 [Hypoxylon sp. FL0890]|nr:hypothetical protein F5Y06DRAFT_303218 [Hypoxylon sp. FL0890]
MRFVIPTILAYAAAVAAMPTNSGRVPLDEKEAREILNEFGENELMKRVDLNSFTDKLPSCSDDPSWAPLTTNYKVNQGVKIPRVGNHDACDGGKKADHCWTEYWLVEAEIVYENWENSGAAIDCRTTARCGSQDVATNQSCTTIGSSDSKGYSGQMIDLAFELAIPGTDTAKIKLGTAHSYNTQHSQSNSMTMCTTSSSDNTCFWDDQKCHQVWFAQRNRRLYGYAARVCEGKTNSKVQQQTQDKNGHWVRGLLDFNFQMPINKIIGCAALCSDQNYVSPKPDNSGPVPLEVDGW